MLQFLSSVLADWGATDSSKETHFESILLTSLALSSSWSLLPGHWLCQARVYYIDYFRLSDSDVSPWGHVRSGWFKMHYSPKNSHMFIEASMFVSIWCYLSQNVSYRLLRVFTMFSVRESEAIRLEVTCYGWPTYTASMYPAKLTLRPVWLADIACSLHSWVSHCWTMFASVWPCLWLCLVVLFCLSIEHLESAQ